MKYFLIDLGYLMAVIAVAAEPDGAGAIAVMILLDLLKRDELPVGRSLVLSDHSILDVETAQSDTHFIISYASERWPRALFRIIPW